jgi:hypothetical protein
MTWLALLVLFAVKSGTTRETLADRVYTIPPADWRYVDVTVRDPAVVECEFHVVSGAPFVRIALVDQQGLAQWKRGLRHDAMAATPLGASGQFLSPVRHMGEYSVIVDNIEGRTPVEVQLRVSLRFSGNNAKQVGQLSTGRRAAVIGISLALFLAVVGYSGRKLLAAWR